MVEARIVELRREHPGWGPRTIQHRLVREGIDPVPGRTSIYRCLIRHGLITPEARKRKRTDYKRWERSRAMELWQMDVVGGVRLADGTEAKIITGVEDHSRFCATAARLVFAAAGDLNDAWSIAARWAELRSQHGDRTLGRGAVRPAERQDGDLLADLS